jgi:hydrogenase maturation protease
VAEPSTSHEVLVIGCGHPLRGDDGVGLVIARLLRGRLPPEMRIIEHRSDGLALLDAWRGARAVILIDAAGGGGAPGTVARFDAASGPLPVSLRSCSTHAFSAGEAIELARVLGELPSVFAVFAIFGERYTMGAGLSGAVKMAARNAIDEVAREAKDHTEFM